MNIKPIKQNEINLFIGSNNIAHEVEINKVEKILNAHILGYTLTTNKGYWKGDKEDSITIKIISDKPIKFFCDIAMILKRELNQYAVLMTSRRLSVYEL